MAENKSKREWAVEWLDSVAGGRGAMSQRKLSSVEQKGGGLEQVREIAEQRGVHLLLLEDDKGEKLLAASKEPFTVVC